MSRQILFPRLHPINWPVAFVMHLFYAKVVYWRSSYIPKKLLSLFEVLDCNKYMTADGWFVISQESYDCWKDSADYWGAQVSLRWKLDRLELDFNRLWLQWIGIQYDEYFKFIKISERFIDNTQNSCSWRAGTMLTCLSAQLRLTIPQSTVPEIKWLGLLDRYWYWILGFVQGIRVLIQMRVSLNPSNPLKESDQKPIKYFFAGIAASEMSDRVGKLDCFFLLQRQLLNSEECLFFLPVKPTNNLRARLTQKNVRWLLRDNYLSQFGFGMYARLLVLFLKTALIGVFRCENRITTPIIMGMAFKALPWVLIGKKIKPTAFLSTVSASWPEESAVVAMNALGVRTINWFYSANVFSATKNAKEFVDRGVEFSIWAASEVWIWSDIVKEWILSRYPVKADKSLQFKTTGPMMCGDARLLYDSPREARKHFGITSDPGIKFISIFDVPTVNEEARLRIGSGPTLYSSVVLNRFFEDLLHVLRMFPQIHFILKPKRPANDTTRECPKAFIELIEFAKQEKMERVTLLDFDIDPYSPVALADLCIGLPFTSPVVTGLRFNRDGIFYDPTNSIQNFFPKAMNSIITHGLSELIERIESCLCRDTSAPRYRALFNEHDFNRHFGPETDPAVRFVSLLKNASAPSD